LNTFKDKENENETIGDLFIVLQSIIELIKFDLLKKEIVITIDKNLIGKPVAMNNYHFRQIMLNLIYNSMEAGAKNIRIYGDMKVKHQEIFVEDDGEGIKIQDTGRIFTPFYTTKSEGVGLGLSICQKIMSQYNGDIKLASSVKGSVIFKLVFKNQSQGLSK
jgi:signal transduction histidine kinase